MQADEFELFDLRVEVVVHDDRKIQCNARVGDYFEVQGEMLRFPAGQGFSMYSLAARLPLLPAKQRVTHRAADEVQPMTGGSEALGQGGGRLDERSEALWDCGLGHCLTVVGHRSLNGNV